MSSEIQGIKNIAEAFYNSCGVGIVVPKKIWNFCIENYGNDWCEKYLIQNKPLAIK